jgi:2-phosphosulfolactate phosphatase
MRIYRKSLLKGAADCSDSAVIVDVFRAFTCSSMLLHYGAQRLILEEDPEKALAAKKNSGYLALGEIGGVMAPGFDFGNSPTEIAEAGREFFRGKRIVQRTSAGVRGIFSAVENCRTVYAAAYTTAKALAGLLKKEPPQQVHLVAMGHAGETPTPEDEQCAAYIHSLLDPDTPYDHASALAEIFSHESAQKFLRGDKPHFPPTDVTWCLQRDIFPFAMKVFTGPEGIELRKVEV